MSQVMRSSVLVQLVKNEQFGAPALRLTLPCGTPSRAGSGVIGIRGSRPGTAGRLVASSSASTSLPPLGDGLATASRRPRAAPCATSFALPGIGGHVEQPAGVVEPILLRPHADLAVPVREDHPVGPVRGRSRSSSGARLMPSSGLSLDALDTGQVGSASAAGRSRRRSASLCVPGCDVARPADQSGERTPPSSVEPLRPFMPPFQRQLLGPLSLK